MSLTCVHENLELSTASIYSYSDSTVSTNDLAPAGVREGSVPVPLLAEPWSHGACHSRTRLKGQRVGIDEIASGSLIDQGNRSGAVPALFFPK